MTGLILKDFLILRKTLRTYLLMLACYGLAAFTGVWSASFVGTFMMVMVAMLPMNVFAYDKQANWDVYGLSLPVGRTRTVAARYVVVLIIIAASVAISILLGAALELTGRMEEELGQYLLTCAVCFVISMVVNAILLPLLYKFGSERARVILFGVLGGTFLLCGLLVALFLMPLGGLDYLKSLEAPTAAQMAVLPALGASAGLVLLTLSFLLSRRFYGNQDL